MDITYTKKGDYYIPDLEAPENIKGFKLEKYSRLRLVYLKENKKVKYQELVMKNQLQKHLIEVQNLSQNMYDKLIKEFKIRENITEELKQKDQIKWVGLMNNISNSADEIVLKEYVYNDNI